MEALSFLIPCLCRSLQLGLDEAIEVGVRIRNQDPTVADSLLKLVSDLNKYPKKDRKVIIKFLTEYLKQNVSIMQSLQNTAVLQLPQSNITREDTDEKS